MEEVLRQLEEIKIDLLYDMSKEYNQCDAPTDNVKLNMINQAIVSLQTYDKLNKK